MVAFRRLTMTARLDRIEAKLPPAVAATREAEGLAAYSEWLDGLTIDQLDAELLRLTERQDADPEMQARIAVIHDMTQPELDDLLHWFSIHPSERNPNADPFAAHRRP